MIKADMRTDSIYRGYRLIAGVLGEAAKCNVIAPVTGLKVQSTVGSDVSSALSAAREWIDVQEGPRRKPNVATVTEYLFALDLGPVSDAQRRMLIAHLGVPNRTLTARQLAHAAGYSVWQTVNLHYGGLGKTIAQHVGLRVLEDNGRGPVWTTALAEGGDPAEVTADPEFRWIMHSELGEAVSNLWGVVDEPAAIAVQPK